MLGSEDSIFIVNTIIWRLDFKEEPKKQMSA